MNQNKPKKLFLDVETLPHEVLTWALYEANALHVLNHSEVCAWSVKWEGGKQITRSIFDYPGYKKGRGGYEMMKELWAIMDTADIIVAHNGDNFDIKRINTEFIKYGLRPPSPSKTVDTLKIARNKFGFGSNRLNDLGVFLGLGEKLENGGMKLWLAFRNGEKKASSLMKKYNAQDVLLLEKVYNVFLPWISNHPNVGMFTDVEVCPKCGSGKLQSRGFAFNATTKYRRFQCTGCGGWGRSTKNLQVVKPIVNVT